MAAPTPDELLSEVNGDAYAGHANKYRTVLLARRGRRRERKHGQRRERQSRPGMRLIGTGAVLLVLLGAGLLAVSYAAQYRYVLGERGQVTASLIEAGALDVGMIIFSLIALGLALAGLASKTERAAIIACAVASAVMNFASADSASWRSVLAWTMPPVFLAFVVDRVVSATRRHVLGMRGGVSPWMAAASGAGRALRFAAMAVLYGVRFVLAPPSTAAGVRRAVLAATPLPRAPERPAIEASGDRGADRGPGAGRTYCLGPAGGTLCGNALPCADHAGGSAPWPDLSDTQRKIVRRQSRPRVTKTALLIERVTERYGALALIPVDEVSQIANTLAPEVDLHPASARTALLKAVRSAGEGDGE